MPMLNRRAALSLPAIIATPAMAQWAPTRPVRVVVAWPAGGSADASIRLGSADASIRLIAPHMQNVLGQPVVIENRGGASGSIGAGVAAQAAPDGYTFLFDAAGQVSNPLLMRGLGFDYARAFAPTLLVALLPNVLTVRADAPVRDVAGLIAHLRANPGTPYASTGIGLMSHLAAVMFTGRERLNVTHVPYRASAQSIPALLAGETFFTFNTTPLVMPLIRDGRLRALAVATPQRIPALPDTPTTDHAGTRL
ncbi:MAG: tripartite tricarboxylate transporter substrate-binding protein [Alphaproteobacteria bacterium]|nr:tripartite tricarboxylate transporter substrate-binding protein [Alphaproteobacteria bacterium]